MTTVIAMLRGVNVGGHNKIGMDLLRELCVSLKLRQPQTYIQSGNVVFGWTGRDLGKLAGSLESAIEQRCGFRPSVVLRTAEDLRAVVAGSPFAKREGINPALLAVFFLATEPNAETAKRMLAIKVGPEEIRPLAREIYVYFPDGMGQSKLPPVLDRTLKIPATARNWNTVTNLLAMAEQLESAC